MHWHMKSVNRFLLFVITFILFGCLVILFSTVENSNKKYNTVIPEQILVVADGYVIDSSYVYLLQQDSIIFKTFKNEELSIYLATIFPDRYLRSTR